MKPTGKELNIARRMQPGVITLNGFLGNDTRPLNEIVSEDEQVLAKLGYTVKDIAQRMEYFSKQSGSSYLDGILIDEKYQVSTDVFRGKLPCPYGHVGLYRKAITTLTNTANGISVTWSSLSIHLISEHGFFEGKGSAFRLEPELLIKALFE